MIRKLVHFSALVALVLLFAGCAGIPGKPGADTVSRLKKVGVVSVAANELNRQYTGLTRFGNERETLDIASWKVDDDYEQQIASAIAKLGKFEAVRIPGAREALLPIYQANSLWDPNARWDAVEGIVKGLASRGGVDAVVIVLRRDSNDFLANTNQIIKGAGFYAKGVASHTAVSVLHLFGSVVLVDGATGRPIASRLLVHNQEGSLFNPSARSAPMQDVPPELSRAKLDTHTEAQRVEIRRRLVDLPRNAWEPTMRALLTPG
jgi:hypothetical protein